MAARVASPFDADSRPDLAVLNFDDSSDSRRTGNVIVLLGDRNGTWWLPLEQTAVELALSRVATGAVHGGGRARVIVAHRQSDCIAAL